MTEYNEELFRKVLTLIKNDRSLWDQNSFISRSRESSCGTTHCIAGWAVALTHGTFKPADNEPNIAGHWILPEQYSLTSRDRYDCETNIEEEAAKLLGLTQKEEIEEIFYYIDEEDYDFAGSLFAVREITFNQMVNRIMEVTGLELSDLLEDDADVTV